ncbi:hypothetical protein [Massilia aerilata]|uniref:Uncharacterized protein n=1 Tax=Massilia aerilata TaxID=453817 RepID=A0ABW0RTI8_9BURK
MKFGKASALVGAMLNTEFHNNKDAYRKNARLLTTNGDDKKKNAPES